MINSRVEVCGVGGGSWSIAHRRHCGYGSLYFLEQMVRKSGLPSFSDGAVNFYSLLSGVDMLLLMTTL